MKTFRSRIRALRRSGMTLAAIGEAIGIAGSSVSDIEQGRTASPRGEAALKLDALHNSRCVDVKSTPSQTSLLTTRRKRA